MNKAFRFCAITAAVAGFAGVASAIDYDEAVDGDLADIASGGTFLNLDIGTNSISGTVGGNPTGGIEEDFVVFDIAAGESLASVILTNVQFAGGNFSTGFRLYADLGFGLEQVASGSFDESDIGTDYLTVWDLSDVGGSAPLGPGSYGIVLAEFTAGQQYSFDINVVPAPGAVALLGLGGVAAIRRRR